jgi:hypothetical protein
MGFQKPNSFHYRDLMDAHGMSLLYGDCPDEVHALVKLLHLMERIINVCRAKETASFNPQSDMNIQMFLNELHEWRTVTPPDVKNMRTSPPSAQA